MNTPNNLMNRRAESSRFDALILPCRSALMSHARRLTDNHAEAEDLVQETLLRGYQHLDAITNEVTVRSWLHVILRNLFYHHYRRRAPERRSVPMSSLNEDMLFSAENGERNAPESQVLQSHRYQATIKALTALPALYRIPVVLADVEGLPYQAIADRLNIPIGTVRSRILRGRRSLRRSLYAWDSSPPP